MSAIHRLSDRASVTVGGVGVDPCHIVGGRPKNDGAGSDIVLEIDTRVVLQELQHCGVAVDAGTLQEFVAHDARKERGRDAYITIARFIICPVLPLSGVRHVVTPKWIWTETTTVTIDDGLVKFKGRCISA